MSCASCSQSLPSGARFCPHCGHEVSRATSEERRVVTVLFADLVGYTGLTEHLDPEHVKRLIDGAFARLVDDINEYGGRVDKILGDGILALFGAPIAHEDDADRAIRAALRMHRSLAAFVEASDAIDQPLELRIGVNTGEVLVGSLAGTVEYTAMGDVVNVASRLQALADPGTVLVGDSTAGLASDEIVLEVVDDLPVRGREQTERVWRVLGRRVNPATARDDAGRPFVGRETQQELFRSVMGLVANGRSAVLSVSGEAGAGKTRLVNQMLDEFPGEEVGMFTGVCAPYGENNAWAPIAESLFEILEVDVTAPPEEIRRLTLEKGVERYAFEHGDPVLAGFTEAVLHLLGHPSEFDSMAPAKARETVFRLIVAGLRRRTLRGPIVVWIDDLHWADQLMIDLLEHIARSLADRPVLVVTAQRDDIELAWPPADEGSITLRMPLEPLSRSESEALVAAVLADVCTDDLADQLYERSGGNPLFLTELAQLARERPDSTALPGSLRALIAARLDRLDPGARAILENAAILGASGPVKALEMFGAELKQDYRQSQLDALVDDGLLEVDGANWRFRSDVSREVAYQTLTKFVRAERHARTAEVMTLFEISTVDRIAHHAATAAELVGEIGPVRHVPDDIDERASRLLLSAGRRSLEVGAFSATRQHVTRALDLGPDDDWVVRELLLVRAEASSGRHMNDAARDDTGTVLAAAIEAGDLRHEGIAHRLSGSLEQTTGDLPTARSHLDRSIEIFRKLRDDVELADSVRERGLIEVFGGSLADADLFLTEADELYEARDDRRGRAWVRQHQAWVAFLSGDADLAEERLVLAAADFDDLEDRDGAAWVRGLLAYVRYFQRRFDEAEEIAVSVREEARRSGDRWAESMMDSLLAGLRLWSGQFAEAEQISRRAVAGFRSISDRFGLVMALAPRIRALAALGRSQEAERGSEEVLAVGEAFGDLAFPKMAAAGAAVHLGLGERASTIAESAVTQTLAMKADGSEARVTLALAKCQIGEPEEALAVLLDVELDRPYPLAVHAVASAMVRDDEVAIEDADAVWADDGATYFDRVLADVAAAAAEKRRGSDDAAIERLDRARTTAEMTGDVVAVGIASCADDTMLEGGEHDEAFHIGPGWHRLIRGVTGIEPHVPLVSNG
jgi:class 3 adenylate cyclase/tetratricopeptide (TPR) repeat protein